MNWNKKNVLKEDMERLKSRYGIDPITASILLRRGITEGRDIFFFLENDLRYQHNPFLFNSMEDAVDRILAAAEKDENGNSEKVLVFGDRDVDGVTATTLLCDALEELGIDFQYKVPQGNEAYGLSEDAVNAFAEQFGSLIITVDCGIANVAETALAHQKGIDVIITDHHMPQEELPDADIILDAHLENSGYPFADISGCALVYKLASALRFAKSRWYKADTALINARTEDDEIIIEIIKLRNLVPVSRLAERIRPGEKSINDTKLPSYLSGQMLLVWNPRETSTLIRQAFGSSIDFELQDMGAEICSMFPSLKGKSLNDIKAMSKIARYGNHEPTEIGGFYNIFVTYVQQSLRKEFPRDSEREEKDLQLVALAAVADVMPLKNENRIFIRKGLESINAARIRPGLVELLSRVELLGKRITSKDIGWTIDPNLNAAGRLGEAGIVADLFMSKDPAYRELTAAKISELNGRRQTLTQEAEYVAASQAEKSIAEFKGHLCFIYDEQIVKGIAGILAGRLVNRHGIPAIVCTCVDDVITGSMRSCRGFDVTDFLEQLKDLFISHGGHAYAAGFSLKRENLSAFKERLLKLAPTIVLGPEDTTEIDAEVPLQYMTPDLINVVDLFEPYGNENPPLVFLCRNLTVAQAFMLPGKKDRNHLKLTVDAGKSKWPCVFWGEGNRLNRDFKIGDKIDILFQVERNTYNGMENLQLNLIDLRKSL